MKHSKNRPSHTSNSILYSLKLGKIFSPILDISHNNSENLKKNYPSSSKNAGASLTRFYNSKTKKIKSKAKVNSSSKIQPTFSQKLALKSKTPTKDYQNSTKISPIKIPMISPNKFIFRIKVLRNSKKSQKLKLKIIKIRQFS